MNKNRFNLDNPNRFGSLQNLIHSKQSLKLFYQEIYEKYKACLERCPPGGQILELGAGAGFSKSQIPEMISSDVLPYEGVDQVVDATQLPFPQESLRSIFMLNVFHHIPDVEKFMSEAERCLVPGGRVLIVDQHVNWMSKLIYTYLHHEPFDARKLDWSFASKGPISDANGALAWIVFMRDRQKFIKKYPSLEIFKYKPHTPFRYWLSGGLKEWSLLPGWAFGFAKKFEEIFLSFFPNLGAFVDIELVKK